MAFIRKIKKKSGTYLAIVESYRDRGDKGKVKQRVKKYLGREIDGKPVRRVRTSNIGVESVKRYGDISCVDKIAQDLCATSQPIPFILQFSRDKFFFLLLPWRYMFHARCNAVFFKKAFFYAHLAFPATPFSST